MPKTLILHDPASAAPAEAVADGARSVRFAEVEVRPLDDAAPSLADYDGLVVVGPAPTLTVLLARATPRADAVVAAFGGDDASRWATLRALGASGCLLVPPGESPAELGKRVATVAEWVRHAKSHHHH